jgi:hypothetical protein
MTNGLDASRTIVMPFKVVLRVIDRSVGRGERDGMRSIWRQRGLGIVLLFMFLAAWAAQGYFGWLEFQAEQMEHGAEAELFGSSGYVSTFLSATMENWQSEFLQLLTFVVLTSWLVWHGSPESRDSDDEMKATLDRIERRLEDIELGAKVANGAGAGSRGMRGATL